jgi:hypothetical protein
MCVNAQNDFFLSHIVNISLSILSTECNLPTLYSTTLEYLECSWILTFRAKGAAVVERRQPPGYEKKVRNENMSKEIIIVHGEDVVVREDTAKVFRFVRWGMITAGLCLSAMVIC